MCFYIALFDGALCTWMVKNSGRFKLRDILKHPVIVGA